ncbi:MAG: cytochrome c nitrite reductase small subunit [Planctomycetes bacterium]|nr:cytochrome c nitrite reductase small subunit [Planctomycetota bacterium]
MNLPVSPRARLGLAAVAAAVLLGALAGSGAYTFSYAEGLSYLSTDPKACVNCHVMREQYDGWQKASHHAHATCNDCHVPQDALGKYMTKAAHGWRHSKAFTLNDFAEPIRILPEDLDIVHDNCVRCHAGLVSELAPPQHAGVPGERVACTRCHGSVAHGPPR